MGSLSRLEIQRLATVGNLASGGGADASDAGVYAAVADWSALSTVPGERRTDDIAPVLDADGSGSLAIAQWSGSQWELVQGVFDTCLLMDTFSNPIAAGATCTVQSTTGPEVYRYQTFGTGIRYWAHSSVPATLTRNAYGVGTEDAAALTLQGYTISTNGAGSSVAPVDGETLLTGGSVFTNNALLTVTGLSPVAGSLVYMRAFARAATTGTLGRGIQIGDGTQAARMYQNGAAGLDLYAADGTTAVTGGVSRVATALPGATSDPALLEIFDRGATQLSTVRVNGAVVLQYRRNLVTLSPFTAVRWLALQSAVIGIRRHMVASL